MVSRRRIAVFADFHTFSLWGMCPPKFETKDPKTGDMIPVVAKLNRTQTELLEHLRFVGKKLEQQNVKVYIWNGDLCDGPQLANKGRQVVSSNLKWQADAFMKLVKETLPEPEVNYFTRSTKYHDLDGMPLDQYIAEHLDGEFGSCEYGSDLTVEEYGLRLHCQHYINVSKSTWQYRPTPLARDMMLMALHSELDQYGNIDIVVRSHAHYFCEVALGHQLGIITPCYQTRTEYSVDSGIVSPPDNGVVIINKEGDMTWVDRRLIKKIGKPCKVVGRNTK